MCLCSVLVELSARSSLEEVVGNLVQGLGHCTGLDSTLLDRFCCKAWNQGKLYGLCE